MMKTKRFAFAAALAIAAACPAFSMAIVDLVGASGNGHSVALEREVRPFTSVIATGSEDVIIHRGDRCRVVVTCDENLQDSYRVRVSGKRLELGFEPGFFLRGPSRVTVDVWLPEISGITVSGSGNVESRDTFAVDALDIVLSGSGSIEGRFSGNSVRAVISGSGDIGVVGSVDGLSLTISGSGDFDGRDLSVRDAEVSIAGSGGVDLGDCETLRATISGSGDVRYGGNPRVTAKVSGSGSVRAR